MEPSLKHRSFSRRMELLPDWVYTEKNPHYCLTSKHHGGMKHMAQWGVEPKVEIDLFYLAYQTIWGGRDTVLWACRENGEALGRDGEIISKYPSPTNHATDPWHGYPVKPSSGNHDIPPKDVVAQWVMNERIAKHLKMRILKGQV